MPASGFIFETDFFGMREFPTSETRSATGRARCRVCGEKIGKGEVEVVAPVNLHETAYDPWRAVDAHAHRSCWGDYPIEFDRVKQRAKPLILSYGMGVDSTAVLVGWAKRGIIPEAILFADVGDEKPETYAYLDIMQAWLTEQGFPPITVVRNRVNPNRCKHGGYTTLFGNCWRNRTVPSLAFGRKACSQKWKAAALDKYVRKHWPETQVQRAIGYDAGPKDSKRGGKLVPTEWDEFVFPLRQWGWDRERCKAEIAAAGLPVPCKSACFFCPSTQKDELAELCQTHPELVALAIAMEDRARPKFTSIEGLWGWPRKGVRDPSKKRPGSWRAYAEELGLIDQLPEVTPEMIAARI
jgi:hypothetical protein